MKVYCRDVSVFAEMKTDERRQLERLLLRVLVGHHDLVIEDLETFFASDFFAQAVAVANQMEVRELLERQEPALADRSIDPAAMVRGPCAELVPITTRERSCRRDGGHPRWEIDASVAGSWSEAPLRLLLENDSDWRLIEAAARVYSRPKVVEARKKSFLHADQRGGKDEVETSVKLCDASERIFLMIDSDRSSVNGPESACQTRIRKLAADRPNVLPFILKKREVENYIPDSVWSHSLNLDAWERTKRYRSWSRLPEDEKDVVDMETYFRDAKKHVPMLCNAALVPDAQTLESRVGGDELVVLLDQLEAWL